MAGYALEFEGGLAEVGAGAGAKVGFLLPKIKGAYGACVTHQCLGGLGLGLGLGLGAGPGAGAGN